MAHDHVSNSRGAHELAASGLQTGSPRQSASQRQKKAFGLLLRRLSENAGLSDAQNTSRDRIYQYVLDGDFERALSVNRELLQAVADGDKEIQPRDATKGVEMLLRNLLGKNRPTSTPKTDQLSRSSSGSHTAAHSSNQLAVLALDRAVLLGMSGQPGEANALLDRLMDARGDDPDQTKAEDIFEVTLGLAELSDSAGSLQDVLTARIRFYYELALENGEEALLETALAALDMRQDHSASMGAETDSDAIHNKAQILAGFGRAHEKTDLLRKASSLLEEQAQHERRAGGMHRSYELVLAALACDIDLARLVSDGDALARIGHRLRDIVDLPDTMMNVASRAQARHTLGHCLTAQAHLDGRIITLRKAFGYLEAAAKCFADLGLAAEETAALTDLAQAKMTAAELLALDPENGDGDLVLAQRYTAEANELRQAIGAHLAVMKPTE